MSAAIYRCRSFGAAAVAALLAAAAPLRVAAHSASDAYLNLTVEKINAQGVLIHGQWDIALRDLDFVLHLDEDGDGRLTWGEVRRHQAAIEHYAYAALHLDPALGGSCAIRPVRQMIDEHADGAYAALFFDVACERTSRQLALVYQLFFPIDPSHRAIVVMRSGADVTTAVLSPQNARIELALER
jgi:hypothetical protein